MGFVQVEVTHAHYRAHACTDTCSSSKLSPTSLLHLLITTPDVFEANFENQLSLSWNMEGCLSCCCLILIFFSSGPKKN